MESDTDNKLGVIMNNVDLLFSDLEILPTHQMRQVLASIEQKLEVMRRVVEKRDSDPENNKTIEAQFVKVEMHGGDISAMDSCDSPLNIDDFEEIHDEVEDEIDIVVEEDGKITQISPEELKILKEKFEQKLQEGSFIEQDYLMEEIIQYSEDQTEKIKKDNYLDENLAEKIEKSYVCKACNAVLSSRRGLENHMNVSHPGHSVFLCVKCNKKFSSDVGLILHIQNKHPKSKSKSLHCGEDNCNYSTHSKQLFRAHRSSHEKNSCLKCPVCLKEYLGGPKAFRNHMKLHTNEKNYSCEICDKKFVSKSRLTYHKTNVHDPPKFQCDNCSKLFRSKVNFERHMLIHSEERPFLCEFCDYRARNAGNLTSHVKAIHKLDDFTVGKRDKIFKKEMIARRILDQKIVKNGLEPVDCSEVLTEVMGNNEAEDYMDSLSHDKKQSIEQLRLKEEQKRKSTKKKHVKRVKPEPPVKRNRRTFSQEEFVPQIVTLTNEKGDLIKAIISVGENMEEIQKVEEDGVVTEETQVLHSFDDSFGPVHVIGQEVQIQSAEYENDSANDNLVYTNVGTDDNIVYIMKT
eukprot:TRINITY_DN23013_c0_g1_i1.p1 TRINITY_DN23013_c0_g1~~TRINITY_DN23013_c0_g1_i1.p1  ORF type:complete len:574 (-),score=144.45 TRINITY_DN23013_c0_g1_i1:29-1750(-)